MLLTIQAPNFSEDASSFRIRILKDLYLLGDIRRFYWIREAIYSHYFDLCVF